MTEQDTFSAHSSTQTQMLVQYDKEMQVNLASTFKDESVQNQNELD